VSQGASGRVLGDEKSVDIYYRIRRGDTFNESGRQRAELIAMMFFLNLENFIIQNQNTPFVEGVEEVVSRAVRHHVQAILSSAMLCECWEREKRCFSAQFGNAVDAAT
jgi:hypothetical protein